MEKPARRVKKVARKSLNNTSKPKVQAKEKVPAIPIEVSTGWREEEKLLEYESEHQPCFSPAGDISEPEDRLRTPVPGEADDSDPDDGFCEIPAEDAVMAGTKRRRIFQQLPNKDDVAKDVMAALPRKGGKTFFPA